MLKYSHFVLDKECARQARENRLHLSWFQDFRVTEGCTCNTGLLWRKKTPLILWNASYIYRVTKGQIPLNQRNQPSTFGVLWDLPKPRSLHRLQSVCITLRHLNFYPQTLEFLDRSGLEGFCWVKVLLYELTHINPKYVALCSLAKNLKWATLTFQQIHKLGTELNIIEWGTFMIYYRFLKRLKWFNR